HTPAGRTDTAAWIGEPGGMSRFTRQIKRAFCRHSVIVADDHHGACCQLCGMQLTSAQGA
ncbi:MAG: hypothetical protein ACHQEA_13225, partial [Gaiellales bacterium]